MDPQEFTHWGPTWEWIGLLPFWKKQADQKKVFEFKQKKATIFLMFATRCVLHYYDI